MKKKIKGLVKYKYYFSIFLILSALLLGSYFYRNYFLQKSPKPLNLDTLATEAINSCQKEKYRPTCYDKVISSLMDPPRSLSMEDSFKVSSIVSRADTEYGFCHVLGHKLAAKETAKNPNKWKEVITHCPSGVCSNGCIHGAFQEKFRYEYLSPEQIEKIKPELRIICQKRPEWSPSGIEQGSCYHALGHLLMYASNADIPKSVSLCQELAINESGTSFVPVCLDGVFMQMFQPLENEDFSLIKGKVPNKDQLPNFCSKYGDLANASCWSESWPLFVPEIKVASGVINLCSNIDQQYRNRCFTSLFYIMPVQFQLNLDKSFEFCAEFSQDLRGKCLAQVAQRLIQTDNTYIDRAVNFCNRSQSIDQDGSCFKELATQASFTFPPNTEEYRQLCAKLPQKWQPLCK